MSHRSGDRPDSEMVFKSRLSQRWSRSAEHFAALRTQDPRQLLRGLLVRERVATLPQVDILPECVIHAEAHAAHDADADRLGLLAGFRAHITLHTCPSFHLVRSNTYRMHTQTSTPHCRCLPVVSFAGDGIISRRARTPEGRLTSMNH